MEDRLLAVFLFVTIIFGIAMWIVVPMLLAPIPGLVMQQRKWAAHDKLNARWR